MFIYLSKKVSVVLLTAGFLPVFDKKFVKFEM